MTCPIYIGIAGWSYDDWKGIVYQDRMSDHLEYISRFVDCIEINSTFYRPPSESNSISWLRRTSQYQDFFFTAKLHKDFTHEGKIDSEMVRQFHVGFEPLLEADKLRQLLVQFRYDFDDNRTNRSHLSAIVDNFSGAFNIVVEVRHKSWENSDSLDFFEEQGISVCNLDYPTAPDSFDLKECIIGKNGYFRLHGRNAEKWFSKAGRDETYNYYYNAVELDGIHKRVERLSKMFESLVVIANNHYKGAEVANALQLKSMINCSKVAIPDNLLKTYPDLESISMLKPQKDLF